jgi:hypothetical protein
MNNILIGAQDFCWPKIINPLRWNKTGVFVIFKTKRELKCQLSGITEII